MVLSMIFEYLISENRICDFLGFPFVGNYAGF